VVGESGVISHEVEQGGEHGGAPQGAQSGVGAVAAPARPAGPRFFTGSFDHSVDAKNRLVLPSPFRARLADGAYLGPLDGYLGLWPEDGFETVLARWEDGIGLGLVSEEVFDAFTAATYHVQPDSQGRIVVHKDLRAFAEIDAPVMVVGARQRIAVWARDRWDHRQDSIPDGPDAALRQAAKDLKL
jgi:MraZ protein